MLQVHVLTAILDTAFCLVLTGPTTLVPSVVLISGLFLLSKLHVHVGLGSDEGSGSVELLVVGGEGVGSNELLVVVGEGVGDDELLGSGNQNLLGILMMMDHVVVANTDLACSFVLSASQCVSPRSVPRQRPSCSLLNRRHMRL
jgi:hypothetical protein